MNIYIFDIDPKKLFRDPRKNHCKTDTQKTWGLHYDAFRQQVIALVGVSQLGDEFTTPQVARLAPDEQKKTKENASTFFVPPPPPKWLEKIDPRVHGIFPGYLTLASCSIRGV